MKRKVKILLVLILCGSAFAGVAYQKKISLDSATTFPIDI